MQHTLNASVCLLNGTTSNERQHLHEQFSGVKKYALYFHGHQLFNPIYVTLPSLGKF
jgi:hypothetical protein